MPTGSLATLNVGSSSLKFSLYDRIGAQLGSRKVRGVISDRANAAVLQVNGMSDRDIERLQTRLQKMRKSIGFQVPAIIDTLCEVSPPDDPPLIGHRIVHGGSYFDGAIKISPDAMKTLSDLSVFAPDHQPYNLEGVLALEAARPELSQYLSFDTAFHHGQPKVATQYAIPKELSDKGLIRFGFHGLNYAWVADQLNTVLSGHPHQKTIALHLGSGASLCALDNGKSIATSMGLTALSGVPMATRCGDIDPGLVLHLIKHEKLSVDEVEDLLCHKSGLLGVSSISANMQDLLTDTAPEAAEAIDLFVYRIVREVGSLQAALGGLDSIVFTGGIGENSAEIRRRICHGLWWTGLSLDQDANLAGQSIISSVNSSVHAAIIPADEEDIIAREALRCFAKEREEIDLNQGPQAFEPSYRATQRRS